MINTCDLPSSDLIEFLISKEKQKSLDFYFALSKSNKLKVCISRILHIAERDRILDVTHTGTYTWWAIITACGSMAIHEILGNLWSSAIIFLSCFSLFLRCDLIFFLVTQRIGSDVTRKNQLETHCDSPDFLILFLYIVEAILFYHRRLIFSFLFCKDIFEYLLSSGFRPLCLYNRLLDFTWQFCDTRLWMIDTFALEIQDPQ